MRDAASYPLHGSRRASRSTCHHVTRGKRPASDFFHRVLEAGVDLSAVRTVLDVGAGDAWFASQLAGRTSGLRIVCWDTGYTPEVLASGQLRDAQGMQLVADRPRTSFDLLLLLDVLEHVADDRGSCWGRSFART